MTIGIINAGDSELAPFLEVLPVLQKIEKSMLTFYTCQYKTQKIITLFSGVCKVNAALAAQILIDTFHVDLIISAGTCGGLHRDVEIFDTIVTTSCTYHDVEETVLTEFHPWLNTPYFQSDPYLLKQAKTLKSVHPLRFGMIASGEYFLDDPAQRKKLVTQYPDVLGVDMESCAIAHVCYVNRIPFISVRTVTDNGTLSGNQTFVQNVDKAAHISMELCLALCGKLVENNA